MSKRILFLFRCSESYPKNIAESLQDTLYIRGFYNKPMFRGPWSLDSTIEKLNWLFDVQCVQYLRKEQHLLYRASPYMSTRCTSRALESHRRLFLQTNKKSYKELTVLLKTIKLSLSVIRLTKINKFTHKSQQPLHLLVNKFFEPI